MREIRNLEKLAITIKFPVMVILLIWFFILIAIFKVTESASTNLSVFSVSQSKYLSNQPYAMFSDNHQSATYLTP